MKKQRESSTDGEHQISKLQTFIDKSCRSTSIEAVKLIQSLKKTIENQEQKLNRFQIILREQRIRMKYLENEYEVQKQNSQRLKKELKGFVSQEHLISCLTGEVNTLRQQKRQWVRLQNNDLNGLIEELKRQLGQVKQRLTLQNKNLKYLVQQKQKKILNIKNRIYKFIDQWEQIILGCEKFEKTLVDQVYRLKNLI